LSRHPAKRAFQQTGRVCRQRDISRRYENIVVDFAFQRFYPADILHHISGFFEVSFYRIIHDAAIPVEPTENCHPVVISSVFRYAFYFVVKTDLIPDDVFFIRVPIHRRPAQHFV